MTTPTPSSTRDNLIKARAPKPRDEFACGMAVAAGIVMQGYRDDTIAGDILSNAGLTTVEAMREAGVETYDIRLCAPVLHHLRDLERSRARAISSQEKQS